MAAAPPAIDVWDIHTFDRELSGTLDGQADLIRNYMTTDHEIFLAHDIGRSRSVIRPSNPYAVDFQCFKETVGRMMVPRTIHAWHYTRLTDAEVSRMFADGIRRELIGIGIADVIVDEAPYTICSAAELEEALQVMHQSGIQKVMAAKMAAGREGWLLSSVILEDFEVERSQAHQNLFPESYAEISQADALLS